MRGAVEDERRSLRYERDINEGCACDRLRRSQQRYNRGKAKSGSSTQSVLGRDKVVPAAVVVVVTAGACVVVGKISGCDGC